MALIRNIFPKTVSDALDNSRPGVHLSASVINLIDFGSTAPLRLDAEIQPFLLPEDICKAGEYRLLKRRNEFLSGRLSARLALQEYLAHLPYQDPGKCRRDLRIVPRGDHRPEVHGLPDSFGAATDLSISHSNSCAGALVANVPCGIDLQHITKTLSRVQERFCSTAEAEMLSARLPDWPELHRLVILWSAKEAAQKAYSHSHKMPGFRELTAACFPVIAGTIVQIQFNIATTEIQEQCMVVATILNDNGLAVCLLPRERVDARAA